MKRTPLATTLLALAALAATACADAPVGPAAPPDRPSVTVRAGLPNPDVDGDGDWCSRDAGHSDDPIDPVSIAALVIVTIDDVNGSCPPGWSLHPAR